MFNLSAAAGMMSVWWSHAVQSFEMKLIHNERFHMKGKQRERDAPSAHTPFKCTALCFKQN